MRGCLRPPARFLALAKQFGTPIEYPFVEGMDGFPEIIAVAKLPHGTVNFGGVWHSDTTYLPQPPMATLLVAREVPPLGGDTLFANQLPRLRGVVERNAATGIGPARRVELGQGGFQPNAGGSHPLRRHGRARKLLIAEHPVVRTHPETGKKALYVNQAHTVSFAGMTEEESAPLLAFLFRHQIRPEFTCRFRWEPGSLTICHNRCAQHYAVNDYHGRKRVLQRITLAGDTPR